MTDLDLIKHKRARQVCHLQKDGTLFAIFISSLQKNQNYGRNNK